MRTFVIQSNRGVEQLVARRAHNPEAGGSSPSPATKKTDVEKSASVFRRMCAETGECLAQRKIPVDLHFIVRLRHKASGAALGLSCAVCFEQPAGAFAGCGAVCQAKILASLKIKNGISLTPLN